VFLCISSLLAENLNQLMHFKSFDLSFQRHLSEIAGVAGNKVVCSLKGKSLHEIVLEPVLVEARALA